MTPTPLDALASDVDARLGPGRAVKAAPLAPLTTFKVGGPADLLVEPHSSEELVVVLSLAQAARLPLTMLGGGSNVLVGDLGVRGVVVHPRGGHITQESATRVRADAAVTMNGLVRWTIGRGLAGLEAWAGTPGTIGGAIHGNAHWGGRLIGELVDRVHLWTARGAVDVPSADMEFGYDHSRLRHTGEIVLAALFVVSSGEPARLRDTARQSLAFRKRTQPLAMPSAGCIFQNPEADETVPDGIPRSAGALVDRAGLKGVRVGGAVVSSTHANFIVNEGGATAADIRSLVERCRRAVRERFDVDLRDEIVYLGEFAGTSEGEGVHTAD